MADIWTPPSGPPAGVASRAEMISQRTDDIDVLSRAVDGDTSTSTIKHRHLTGTLATRPTPGEAGRLYVPTDLPVLLHDDGTEWNILGDGDPRKVDLFRGIFNRSVEVDTVHANWDTRDSSGTGAESEVSGAVGQIRLSTGTSAGSLSVIRSKRAVNHFSPSSICVVMLRFQSENPASGNQDIWLGPFDTGSGNPNNGYGVRKQGPGNWFGVVRSGSADSGTVDLGVSSGMQTVVIERRASSIHFFLTTWNAAGEKGNVSASLPTANMVFGAHITNPGGAVDRRLLFEMADYWRAR